MNADLVETLDDRDAARRPWYRALDHRYEFTLDNEVEFRRLIDACDDVPIWLAARAAEIIAARRGCELREAWDRLAFNLERMCAGIVRSL